MLYEEFESEEDIMVPGEFDIDQYELRQLMTSWS